MLAVTVLGYGIGMLRYAKPASSAELNRWFKFGAIATIVLFLPSILISREKDWRVIASIGAQGQAYADYQEFLSQGGSHAYFALLRGLLAPFTLSVVPLLFLRWNEFSWPWRLTGLTAMLCTILYSFARGADKETVELALFVLLAFGGALLLRRERLNIGRHLFKIVLVVVALALAAALFVTRKNERSGEVQTYCQPVTGECADYSSPVLTALPEVLRMPANIFFNYLRSGDLRPFARAPKRLSQHLWSGPFRISDRSGRARRARSLYGTLIPFPRSK